MTLAEYSDAKNTMVTKTNMSWKKIVYSRLELINPDWVKKLRDIEINLDEKFELKKMASDEERDQAKGVSLVPS